MMIRRAFRTNEFYLFLVLVAFSMTLTIINPAFFSLENLFDLIRSSAGMAVLAIGVFLVLLSGGIDVSFTAIAIAGQYVSVNALIALGVDNLYLALLISCSLGIALGSINALLISIFEIPTLIATLGTLNVFHGALLAFVGTKAVNVGQMPDCFKAFGAEEIVTITAADGSTYGLSIYFYVVIAVVAVSWVILRYTMLGRGIYAIGGNREAAKRAGFNIVGTQFFIYCYVGFLAGLMGVMHVSVIRYSNLMYIVGTELSVIAAVVLGGARITGGSGSILGTILGVAMIVILEKNLVLMGLSSYWHQFFVGLIIIIGVSTTYYQSKLRSRRTLAYLRQ
ncbi:MAG: ABC transporter permease [Spirochaetota bacterium]